ncbi:unnamed protein product [Cochlearia groenlandica]
MLNLFGFRILIDCPLDLSALTIFAPVPYDVGFEASDVPMDAEDPIQKKQKLERQMTLDDLVCAEPWYKTVTALHLWELSLIDMVLISNPMGLLGLPFLTQNPRFCAKIYMTEATARIGQLMMEDLVSMHMEFRRFHGPYDSCFPLWIKNLDRVEVPPLLKKVVFGENGDDLGSWMRLYSLENVKSCMKKVPIFVISSVAEELLAYANTIPEWLCEQRQEKLIAGEPSFGHLKFIKDKKIHLFPAIHSPDLITSWQEPCIVFAPHWSLRLGPSVQLLRRWRGDPTSLLVLEDGISSCLGLLPFRPMAMKILQCSFLSGIRLQKLPILLSVLQPKTVLMPDAINQRINLSTVKTESIMNYYSENKTLCVPQIADNADVEIMAELVSKLSWIKLNQCENIGIARLKGELVMEDGKHSGTNRTTTDIFCGEPPQTCPVLRDRGKRPTSYYPPPYNQSFKKSCLVAVMLSQVVIAAPCIMQF